MPEPAKLDPSIPTVRWDGKDWPVPELAPKQLDLIWDDVIVLSEALKVEKADELGGKLYALTGEQMKALRNVVYVGLTRAHPELTRDDFADVPATPMEMLLAFFVVRNQSLIYGRPSKEPPKGEGGPPEA